MIANSSFHSLAFKGACSVVLSIDFIVNDADQRKRKSIEVDRCLCFLRQRGSSKSGTQNKLYTFPFWT